jgi:hypothetical protein
MQGAPPPPQWPPGGAGPSGGPPGPGQAPLSMEELLERKVRGVGGEGQGIGGERGRGAAPARSCLHPAHTPPLRPPRAVRTQGRAGA